MAGKILDSGDRTVFESGAVRDMRAGKGRMDLLPLGVVEELLDEDEVIIGIRHFMEEGLTLYLRMSIRTFADKAFNSCCPTMLLEVGKHFEEGAKKYGENNWQKGIEPKYYIDSAIRHYLKWLRGDKDEPHDRAFVWNIMCCIWEVDWHEKKVDDADEKEEPSCKDCKYFLREDYEEPCHSCLRSHIDKFEAKKTGKTCSTCKHSEVLSSICSNCRYYCNWEAKEGN